MGNDDDGVLGLQFVDQLFDLQRGDRVEGRARFVEQQHFRLHGDGAGDHQALLLTTGEAEGRLVQTILDLLPQCRALERPLDGFVEHALLLDALDAQAVDDVLVDALGERVGLLEHHANATTQVGHILALAVDIVTVEVDGAFDTAAVDQIIHTVEAAQQGRLAAAGRADEGGHALARDVHADVEQRLLLAVVQAEIRHFDGHRLFGQVQTALVTTEGRDVDGMRVGLHVLAPFAAASCKLQAASPSQRLVLPRPVA